MSPVKLFLTTLFALSVFASAAFVPPAEGPVPFRRDRLPVDVDTMTALSQQLVTLTGAVDAGDAAGARRVAQMLAVAMALDPANRQGVNRMEQIRGGGSLPAADPERIGEARNRVWHLMGWLRQPEAGPDGNQLAGCLADIMTAADPEHPRAVKLAKKGEQGKWEGWVAAVDDFRDQKPEMVEKTDESPLPAPEVDQAKALKLATAQIRLPVWHVDRVSKELVLRPVMVEMKAGIKGDSSKVAVKLPDKPLQPMAKSMGQALTKLLEARHGSVPKGLQLEFSLPPGISYPIAYNGNALTGAMMVLADAALSGTAPVGLVLAEVGADGTLATPPRFWQTLRALADQKPGYRVVLPSSSGKFLPPLITLDKAEFFMTHEVLLADDLDELLDLGSSTPAMAVGAAHKSFETIREARGSRSLGSFLNHSSTQQRLAGVVEELPEHASARMLALRGTSKWPKRLPREVFAREIRGVVEPIGRQFKVGGWMTLDGDVLEAVADSCRDELENVEGLFGSVSDRQELHAPAMSLVKTLNKLAVDSKRSDAFDGGRYDLQASYQGTWKEYARLIALLTEAAGDTKDYALPDPDRIK